MTAKNKFFRKTRSRPLQVGTSDPLLATYLEDIADTVPLSAGDEARLAGRIRAGDETARNILVEANLRFVVSVSKEYQNRGLSLVELISAGNVGLIVAAERFDETRGFKFISYAVWWIRQAIMQALGDQSAVRVPANRTDTLAKITRTYGILQQEGGTPTLEKVADTLGFTEEKVVQTLVDNQPVKSLDAPFETEDDRCLLDYLPDEVILSPEDQMLQYSLREDIDRVLEGLSPREAEVLRLYFGLENEPPLTLDQIGTRFRLTRERVRQIKELALSKLRNPRMCGRLRGHIEG
jgi:RNA polymerase primary sigma factor